LLRHQTRAGALDQLLSRAKRHSATHCRKAARCVVDCCGGLRKRLSSRENAKLAQIVRNLRNPARFSRVYCIWRESNGEKEETVTSAREETGPLWDINSVPSIWILFRIMSAERRLRRSVRSDEQGQVVCFGALQTRLTDHAVDPAPANITPCCMIRKAFWGGA